LAACGFTFPPETVKPDGVAFPGGEDANGFQL